MTATNSDNASGASISLSTPALQLLPGRESRLAEQAGRHAQLACRGVLTAELPPKQTVLRNRNNFVTNDIRKRADNVADPKEILLPDGTPLSEVEQPATERKMERDLEDDRFTPVIIKRTDEGRRHPDDTLEKAIAEGLEQCERRSLSLLLSACAAGLIVGFSVMAVAVATTLTIEMDSPILERLLPAFVYPLGFIVCLISGAQLFTEHTATAVYPVLDRRTSIASLLRLWCLVIVGNLLGAAASGLLLTAADPVIGAHAGYAHLGRHLIAHDTLPLFMSALLAGWLMALGAWLMLSSPRVGAQITLIYVVTYLIGLGGLHHSIAGSVEVFAALFNTDEVTLLEAVRFIGLALVGNWVGGSLFVALLNYAHIRRTQASKHPQSKDL